MARYNWEQDVEYLDLTDSGFIPKINDSYSELRLDSGGFVQDRVLEYDASSDRHVKLRVLGQMANGPVVRVDITDPKKARAITGVMIGCLNPDEQGLIPSVIRTNHVPVIERDTQRLMLPAPAFLPKR